MVLFDTEMICFLKASCSLVYTYLIVAGTRGCYFNQQLNLR